MIRVCIIGFAALVALALPARAGELITLLDGTSYVGEVKEVTATHVTVDVQFPLEETKRIPRESLTDRTLWRILSERLGEGDAGGWMELSRWAEERGLLVQALLGFRRAARDEAFAREASARSESLETRLAQELFDRGEEYYVNARPASAKRYFEILVARYPSAPVAPIASTRLEQIASQLAEAKAAARAAAEAAKADRVLRKALRDWDAEVEAIRAHLREAAGAQPAHLDFRHPVRTSRALEHAVTHLETAWRRVQNLGRTPEGVSPELADELVEEVRSRLARAYLDTGLAYLMRPSINQAEEYCTKACDLDPDNSACHGLLEKIIYARLAAGSWGADWRARRRR